MIIYATPLDLARWMYGPDATEDQAPSNAVALLRSASILCRAKTRRALYRVDKDTQLPEDAIKRQAFNDAACAMASTWSGLGIDPSKGGVAGMKTSVASKSIGSTSVTYVQNDGTEAARQALASGAVLTFEAFELLSEAELMTSGVGWTRGTPPRYVLSQDPIDIETGQVVTGAEW